MSDFNMTDLFPMLREGLSDNPVMTLVPSQDGRNLPAFLMGQYERNLEAVLVEQYGEYMSRMFFVKKKETKMIKEYWENQFQSNFLDGQFDKAIKNHREWMNLDEMFIWALMFKKYEEIRILLQLGARPISTSLVSLVSFDSMRTQLLQIYRIIPMLIGADKNRVMDPHAQGYVVHSFIRVIETYDTEQCVPLLLLLLSNGYHLDHTKFNNPILRRFLLHMDTVLLLDKILPKDLVRDVWDKLKL